MNQYLVLFMTLFTMNNTRATVHMNNIFEAKTRKGRVMIFEEEKARVRVFFFDAMSEF